MNIVSKILGIINSTNPANPTNGKRVLFAKSDGWYDKNSAGVTAKLATTSDISAPYLVYTALLTQSGTDAPVATVLENTLGGTVVWTRTGDGQYTGTLAGAYTENKTYISALYPTANFNEFRFNRATDNTIVIQSEGDTDYGYATIPMYLEIRVYP